MTWNWFDFVVITLALAQIGLFVAIVLVLGRIKNGAVARFAAAIGRNVESGKKLIETGKSVGTLSLPHLQNIRARLSAVPRYLRPVKLDTSISVGEVVRYVGMGQLLLARPGKSAPATRLKRTGFAERAGLIPPVWQKIAPLWGYVGIAVSAWREVQKQLPTIRRAVSEAQQKRIDKPAESGL
ncbi:MAG: hypothetical protein H7Y38_13860 [Armatimonadetes bacterium]|nr:hypothetical protein [Armatimonadota bacterium]